MSLKKCVSQLSLSARSLNFTPCVASSAQRGDLADNGKVRCRFISTGGVSSFVRCQSASSGLQQELPERRILRSHSTVTPSVPKAAVKTAVSKDLSREFMARFPDLVRDLTEAGRHLDIPEVTKWFAKVLQYNVPGGKKNRGLAVVSAYQILTPPEKQTEADIRMAHILGWCVEMLQAFLLVEDDIMDHSKTRRGRPCWYQLEEVGTSQAINDGILLEQGIYQILRRHCKNQPYYLDLLELFHDVTFKTTMGQSLDISTSNSINRETNRLDKFTMDRYNAIVKYKTAYYSFHLPIAIAMYMVGINDQEIHRQAKIILLEMGHFFQVQDDFLDCYGEPEITGKIGTDIEDGKCSWLAVVALQRATPSQRALLEQCYGYNDPEKVAAVKQVYQQLGLPQIYSRYEEDSYNLISTHIQQLSTTRGLHHELFFKVLEKIYRRES